MVTQNDNSARGVELGALLSTEETRKLWKEYQAGTIDKWMYGDLPLGWSQVISRAQAALTLKEVGEWLKDRCYTLVPNKYRGSIDACLHPEYIEALLNGQMPEGGSPATPPPGEAIKP